MATIKIKYKRRSQTSQSAEKVASNDDLITKILLCLPIRSVLHFKSVSKHWLSLITSPRFSLLRIPHRLSPSALFLQTTPSFHTPRYEYKPEYEYVPFDSEHPTKPPFRTLTFTTDYDGIRIIQSCNGLLFCCSSRYCVLKFYIYNPTTGQFTTLPPLPRKIRNTLSYSTVLAFDPSRSPHHKVIRVGSSKMGRHHKMYQIVVYSSETGLWSVCGQPFTADNTNFRKGVYVNGAVHWTSFSDNTYYFKIDEERLETMPMPQVPNRYYLEQTFNGPSYFGESCGHLHHVETYGPRCTVFDVYEMEKDYSTWSVKYQVDLDELPNVFPGPFRTHRDPVGRDRYRIQILTIVRGEKEEDSFLVLVVPGKVIKYNPAERTFKKLYDIAPGLPSDGVFEGSNAFEFIESLSCV